MSEKNEISIVQWLDKLLARGAYSFATEALQLEISDYSNIAIKRSLSRLSTKGKIVSLYKGYYLILTPQYASKGILPPQMYLDAFMKYLQRPYYVALLNAAAFHGASHQQPQEYFVMTDFPVLRPTQKKGLKINYISIKEFPQSLIEKLPDRLELLFCHGRGVLTVELVQCLPRKLTYLGTLACPSPTADVEQLVKALPRTLTCTESCWESW